MYHFTERIRENQGSFPEIVAETLFQYDGIKACNGTPIDILKMSSRSPFK